MRLRTLSSFNWPWSLNAAFHALGLNVFPACSLSEKKPIRLKSVLCDSITAMISMLQPLESVLFRTIFRDDAVQSLMPLLAASIPTYGYLWKQ